MLFGPGGEDVLNEKDLLELFDLDADIMGSLFPESGNGEVLQTSMAEPALNVVPDFPPAVSEYGASGMPQAASLAPLPSAPSFASHIQPQYSISQSAAVLHEAVAAVPVKPEPVAFSSTPTQFHTQPVRAAAVQFGITRSKPIATRRASATALNTEDPAYKRKERNKRLARRTRLRKKFLFTGLQQQVHALHTENLRLREIVAERCGEQGQTLLASMSAGNTDLVTDCVTQATNLIRRSDFMLVKVSSSSSSSLCTYASRASSNA